MAWITSKLGVLGCMILALGIVAGACYWCHHVGYASAQAHYEAAVTSCVDANTADAATIAKLKAANDAYAASAEAQAQAVNRAIANTKADADAAHKARDAAIKKLHEVESQHGDAKAWAATRVPDSILDSLGLRDDAGSAN